MWQFRMRRCQRNRWQHAPILLAPSAARCHPGSLAPLAGKHTVYQCSYHIHRDIAVEFCARHGAPSLAGTVCDGDGAQNKACKAHEENSLGNNNTRRCDFFRAFGLVLIDRNLRCCCGFLVAVKSSVSRTHSSRSRGGRARARCSLQRGATLRARRLLVRDVGYGRALVWRRNIRDLPTGPLARRERRSTCA